MLRASEVAGAGSPIHQSGAFRQADLDAIVTKALHSQPLGRYDSAAGLAADVDRFLQGEPVEARQQSIWYRFTKLVARHKVASAAAALALVSIIAFSAGVTMLSARLVEEQKATRAVADFMDQMVTEVDPQRAGRPDIPFHEILDKAARQLEDDFDGAPAIRAELSLTLGTAYEALGRYEEALRLLEGGLELAQSLERPFHRLEIGLSNRLAEVLMSLGEPERAEKLMRHALTIPNDDAGVTVVLQHTLGNTLEDQSKYEEAEAAYRKALAGRLETDGPDSVETFKTMSNFAIVFYRSGRYPEAEKLLRDAIEGYRRTDQTDHPEVLKPMSLLASVLSGQQEDRFDEILPLRREVLERTRKIYGDDHSQTLLAMSNMTASLLRAEDFEAAEPAARESLAAHRRLLGEAHMGSLIGRQQVGEILTRTGRPEEGLPFLLEAIEVGSDALGEDHWRVGLFRASLARCELALGKPEAARATMSAALATLREQLGPEHPRTLEAIREARELGFEA